MNLEISYKAREIIDAHIKGQPIVLRYKGIGGSWFPLTGTAHLNWNFAKYEYKIDNKEKTEEEEMAEVYKTELGSSFETVDHGVGIGNYE